MTQKITPRTKAQKETYNDKMKKLKELLSFFNEASDEMQEEFADDPELLQDISFVNKAGDVARPSKIYKELYEINGGLLNWED